MPKVRALLHRWRRRTDEHPVPSTDAVLMARACPEKVLVEENYRVRQEISRNPDIVLEEGATGVIRVELPYDGHRHVTRTTVEDVNRWLARQRSDPTDEQGLVEGRIGHLVIAGHQDTSLADVTGLTDRTVSIPVTVPFRSPAMNGDRALLADRFTFRRSIAYSPDPGRPKVVPVQLKVQVVDPGSVTVQKIQPDDAVAQSEQYMTFRNYLELRITVQVDMHNRKHWTPPSPLVRRINLSLPSGLPLALSSVRVKQKGTSETLLVHQNLTEGGLEWYDVPLWLNDLKEDRRSYLSPQLTVYIHQPGELFREPELVVRADVQTDGVLLSGADARLFDASGERLRVRPNPLTIRSRITTEAVVVLDDAFAKRTVRPQLKFHFDEVLPGKARVADVVAALVDLRFDVKRKGKWDNRIARTPTAIAALTASRGDPDDAVWLFIYITGRQQRTERQSQHPGGRRFTSKLDTGDMTLVVYGAAPRDARELIHDVNALQLSLRERFRRMQAQR